MPPAVPPVVNLFPALTVQPIIPYIPIVPPGPTPVANLFPALTASAAYMASPAIGYIHAALTAGSFLPSAVGAASSLADGMLYFGQGDWTNGGIALAAAGFGLATDAGLARVALKSGQLGVDVLRGAAERGLPLVTRNKIAGDAFRDELGGALRAEGRDVTTEVYKSTPFGKRFIDIEVSKDGQVLGGIETKVGSSRYAWQQQLKDWWLKNAQGYTAMSRGTSDVPRGAR